MGMFDSVNFSCPRCDKSLEVQSKAGDCYLATFSQDKVPVVVAADIKGEKVWCENCSCYFTILELPNPTTVSLRLVRE